MLHRIDSLGQATPLFSLLLLLLMGTSLHAATPAPFPPPQPAGPLFQERPFGPLPQPTPTPSPRRFDPDDGKPIPREWIIAGAAAALLAIAGILYGSARAWHSSNIFDQQYRFPVNEQPALRFGGHRSGGHMATIHLDGSPGRKRVPGLKAEDA